MVYNQSSENDYNSGREGMDFEDEREMSKFDDENYQAKLRKAINTNINHVEISRLKWISSVFLVLLFVFISLQLLFSVKNMSMIEMYAEEIREKATEMQYLTKYIAGTLDPIYDKTVYFEEERNYNVTFDSDLEIQFKL